MTAVAARSVENLVIQGNRFSSGQLPIQTNACAKTLIAGNALGVSEAEANPKTSTPQADSSIDK